MRCAIAILVGVLGLCLSACANGYIPTGPYYSAVAEPRFLDVSEVFTSSNAVPVQVTVEFFPIRVQGAAGQTITAYTLSYHIQSPDQEIPSLAVPLQTLENPIVLPEPMAAASPASKCVIDVVAEPVRAYVRERPDIRTLDCRIQFVGRSSDGKPANLMVNLPVAFRSSATR